MNLVQIKCTFAEIYKSMFDTIPYLFREITVKKLFTTGTLANCWPTWQTEIRNRIGTNYNADDLINLGDQLSDIFRATGGGGRGQGSLSASGTAWESLVCWYINLCTSGSRIVASRTMSLNPNPVRDAISVNYGSTRCNSESDITITIFPDLNDYNINVNMLNVLDRNTVIPSLKRGKLNKTLLDFLANRDFTQYEVGIIQCKTNWNDNAQIPMLWDMIYSVGRFRNHNIQVGFNNFSIHSLRNFTYSFATVPSNQRTIYSSNSTAVKRVSNLSGGNYWGKPTQQNVARSIKEIFANYSSGFRTSLRVDLSNAIPQMNSNGLLNYFQL